MVHEVLTHVWRIPMMPTVAPRCFGLFASCAIVSETERKRNRIDFAVHGDQGLIPREGEDTWKYSMAGDPHSEPRSISLFVSLTFGAMPIPAGVIRDLQMTAVVTLIFMTAKDSGSADLDGAHDPQLMTGQPMDSL